MKKPTTINPYVGQRIRMERKRLGISQETLASDLNISVNYLGEMERGRKIVSLKMAEKLCQYFHLTLDYLYRGIAPDRIGERTGNEANPYQELLQLMEMCNEQELRLCLDVIKPLLVTWRTSVDTTGSQDRTEPSKTWFSQKC